MTLRFHLLAASLGLAASASATPQDLLIPDSTGDTIMSFNANDGSLINQTFIDLVALGAAAATPLEVFRAPNGELWISDQFADTVFRFSGDGTTFIGQVAGPIDNARGLDVRNGNIFIANAGTNGGAPGEALVEIDVTTGANTASTPIGSPFDAIAYNFNGTDGFLVSDIVNEDIVFVNGADPSIQTIFHESDGITGIDFPEQISLTSSGTVLVAGFTAPSGIYEYDSMGNEINYIDTGAIGGLTGIRAVQELGNGNLLFTNGGGVHIYETSTMTITTVLAGVSARFISGGNPGPGPGLGQPFCMANANSTGMPGLIAATGSDLVSANNVTLSVSQIPANEFGIFVVAPAAGGMGVVNQGILCLTGPTGRYTMPGQIWQANAGGTASLAIDLTMIPTPSALVATSPGDTWFFQAWHRDVPPMGAPAGSNFTTGVEVTFN